MLDSKLSCSFNMPLLYLHLGLDVDAKGTERNETALMITLHGKGDLGTKKKCVEILLKANADVNIFDRYYGTALNDSVDYPEIVEMLLKAGAPVHPKLPGLSYDSDDPDVPSDPDERIMRRWPEHFAPLTDAVMSEQPESVRLLLNFGADPNYDGDNMHVWPILFAARYGNLEILKLLVEHGANINKDNNNAEMVILYNSSPCTAFINAIYVGAFECAEYLLSKGARLARSVGIYREESELFLAARVHSRNCIKLLLNADIVINKKDDKDHNALEEYIVKDNEDDFPKIPDVHFDHIWTDVAMLLYAAGEILEEEIIHNEYRHPYTGKITQEEIEVPEAILYFIRPYWELKDACRQAIRRHLLKIDPGKNLFLRVPKLGLPENLQSYLLYDCTLEYGPSESGPKVKKGSIIPIRNS